MPKQYKSSKYSYLKAQVVRVGLDINSQYQELGCAASSPNPPDLQMWTWPYG